MNENEAEKRLGPIQMDALMLNWKSTILSEQVWYVFQSHDGAKIVAVTVA